MNSSQNFELLEEESKEISIPSKLAADANPEGVSEEYSLNTSGTPTKEEVSEIERISAELKELKTVGIEILDEESGQKNEEEDLTPEDFPFLSSK